MLYKISMKSNDFCDVILDTQVAPFLNHLKQKLSYTNEDIATDVTLEPLDYDKDVIKSFDNYCKYELGIE